MSIELSSLEHAVTRRYDATRVLITGGSGYIGTALQRRLGDTDAEIHVLARSANADSGNTKLTVHSGDVIDLDFVRSVCRQVSPTHLFHLAGRTNASQDLEHVMPTFQVNAMGTLNVLLSVAEFSPSCRVVHCASMEEPNTDPVQLNSPYGASKLVGTTYVSLFKTLYGISSVSLRVFFVYGPGKQPMTKLVPYVIGELREQRAPSLQSSGRAMDWVYIDDVVDAFLKAGMVDAARIQRPIDIGTGTLTRIRDVVDQIAVLMGCDVQSFEQRSSNRSLQSSPVAATSEALRRLNWQATTSLENGLAKTVSWYQNEQAS